MKLTTVAIDGFLLAILIIPFLDRLLQMDLNKVHKLLHKSEIKDLYEQIKQTKFDAKSSLKDTVMIFRKRPDIRYDTIQIAGLSNAPPSFAGNPSGVNRGNDN